MHHKQLSREQFDDYKKKLRTINAKLNRAIDILEDEIYSEVNITDVAGAIARLTKFALQDMMPEIKSILETLSKVALSIMLPDNNLTKVIENIGNQFDTSQLLGTATLEATKAALNNAGASYVANSIQHSLPDMSYLKGIQSEFNNPTVESIIRSGEIVNKIARPYIDVQTDISDKVNDANDESKSEENKDEKGNDDTE